MIGAGTGACRSGSRRRCLLLAVSTLLLTVLLLVGCSDAGASAPRGVAVDPATQADFDYTIPAGASKLGGQTTLLPSPLVMHVGQVIRIVNLDDVGYDL